ncbi:MAG: hypothetical protein ACRC0M_11450, partial [Legionella sp.]
WRMNHKLKTASLRSGLIAIEWNTRSASNGILDRDEVESVIGISGIRNYFGEKLLGAFNIIERFILFIYKH